MPGEWIRNNIQALLKWPLPNGPPRIGQHMQHQQLPVISTFRLLFISDSNVPGSIHNLDSFCNLKYPQSSYISPSQDSCFMISIPNGPSMLTISRYERMINPSNKVVLIRYMVIEEKERKNRSSLTVFVWFRAFNT